MEPVPTRAASIAMGTGSMDCVPRTAFYELEETTREHSGKEKTVGAEGLGEMARRDAWRRGQDRDMGID